MRRIGGPSPCLVKATLRSRQSKPPSLTTNQVGEFVDALSRKRVVGGSRAKEGAAGQQDFLRQGPCAFVVVLHQSSLTGRSRKKKRGYLRVTAPRALRTGTGESISGSGPSNCPLLSAAPGTAARFEAPRALGELLPRRAEVFRPVAFRDSTLPGALSFAPLPSRAVFRPPERDLLALRPAEAFRPPDFSST